MTYPTQYDIKIKINGVDRTDNVVKKRVTIKDVLGQNVTADIPIDKGAALSLTGLQTVIISNDAETVRYFGGVITGLDDDEINKLYLKYMVACEDFGWYLDHPEVLIDTEYTGDSDQTIIQAFMATCCPDIDHDVHVDEVLASIDYIRFENETPLKALERLAKMAGAEFYVDFGDAGHPKGHLHYFASGTNAAPWDLSDAPDGATTMAYQDLHRTDRVPDVNYVTVVGRNQSVECFHGTVQDTKQGTAVFNLANGDNVIDDDGQDFNDWKTVAGNAAYMIVAKWSSGSLSFQAWAYLGNVVDADTIKVYKDIALAVGGWNGYRTIAQEIDSYNIYLADGDYGYWIKHKIVDNDLITMGDLIQRGNQFLADVAGGVSYTLMCLEPGLRTGMDITLVDALRSVNTSFMIRRMRTQFTVDGYARHLLELGARRPRFADVLVGGRNIWDEEKFLPRRPGLIEQEDAGTDVQTSHYLDTYNDQLNMPSYEAVRKSYDDVLGTLTETQDDEEIWLKEFCGVDSGSGWALGSYMQVIQDGAAGAAYVPVEMVFGAYDDAGSLLKLTLDGPAGMAELDGHLGILGQKEMRFYEGANYVGFEAPALAADQIWVLPTADGNADEVLTTDGAGNLSWGVGGGGFTAGSVIFAAGSGLAEDNANLFWDDTNDELGVGTNTPAGKVHIEQDNAAAAIPVLVLDQADVDEPFILAIGEAAAANLTRSIVDEGDQGSETLEGWVMVEVEDVGNQITDQKYFVPFYSLSA